MTNWIRLLTCFVLACAPATMGQSGEKKAREIEGWGAIVDPDGDCTIQAKSGKVTITVPGKTHDLNPLIRTNSPGTTDEFFKGRSTHLRLERKGNEVTASYSHDGKEWTAVKTLTVDLPAQLQVGVAAVNSSNREFVVEFDQFKVDVSN